MTSRAASTVVNRPAASVAHGDEGAGFHGRPLVNPIRRREGIGRRAGWGRNAPARRIGYILRSPNNG